MQKLTLKFPAKLSKTNRLPLLLLIMVGIIGVLRVPSVGISWDEPGQRESAGLSVMHVAQLVDPNLVPAAYKSFSSTASDLSKNGAFDHGVAFDAPILIGENILGINSTRDIYLFHHFMIWLSFLLGLGSIFLICRQRFKSNFAGYLGSLFLLLSPRIFAEGFYNTKDIPFLSFILFSSFFTLKALNEEKRSKHLIWAAFVGGFATDIRILGLVQMPLVIGTLFLLPLIKKSTFRSALRESSIYLATSLLSIYMFFPYLWGNPLINLLKVVKSMANYPWTGFMLFDGSRVQAQHLPWYYLPTWISITTPIFYLILAFIGVIALGVKFFRVSKNRTWAIEEVHDLYMLLFGLIPLAVIISLHSTVYDTWRHVYFIYPYILYFSVYGITSIYNNWRYDIWIIHVLVCVELFSISAWMVTNNPIQNLYFNSLAGTAIADNWEMDYWGLSNESALRWILDNDNRTKISLQEVSFTPLSVSAKMLSAADQSRLVFETNTQPSSDYLVNNFRSGTSSSIKRIWPGYSVAKSFKVDKAIYLQILKKNE